MALLPLQRVALSMIAGSVGLGDGVNRTLLEKLQDTVSVKDFGAKGDSTTDDTAAIQAAFTWAVARGSAVYFPAGSYRVTSQITVDKSNSTSEDAARVDVVGAGAGCTVIKTEVASGPTLYFKGPETDIPGAAHAYQRLAEIRIQGQGHNSIAVAGENLPYFAAENVVVLYCEEGFRFTDIMSSHFSNVIVRSGVRGFTAQRGGGDSVTDPNNINFYSCTFSSLSHYALYFNGGADINFFGGSIENIGLSYQWPTALGSRPTARWGMKIDNAGREGGVGVAMYGTYIEGNDVQADFWADQPDNPPDTGSPGLDDTDDPHGYRFTNGVAYCFSGVNFHRIFNNDPVEKDDTSYPRSASVNNIRIDSGTKPFALSATGCGFRGAGSYTPSDLRPCIQLPLAARGWEAELIGNYFSHDADAPPWTKTPAFTYVMSGDQTIPNDANTLLNFVSAEDYGNCYDGSVNGFVAPYKLRMRFVAQVHFNNLTDGNYVEVALRRNGSVVKMVSAAVKGAQNFTVVDEINLAKGDFVNVTAFQNSGANRNVYSSQTLTKFTGSPA